MATTVFNALKCVLAVYAIALAIIVFSLIDIDLEDRTSERWRLLAGSFWAVQSFWFFLLHECAARLVGRLKIYLDPSYIERLRNDLVSPRLRKRRWAIQVLSDFYGYPLVDNQLWPWQIETWKWKIDENSAVVERLGRRERSPFSPI